MIEWTTLAFAAGAVVGLVLGARRGRQIEEQAWRDAAIDHRGADHIRRGGNDYTVMLLDTFYRDYHNPLVRARSRK